MTQLTDRIQADQYAEKAALSAALSPDMVHGGSKGGVWLLTFTDLVLLLLTFFVMLFSMSELDRMTFQQMINAIPERRDVIVPETPPASETTHTVEHVARPLAENLSYLRGVLKQHMATDALLRDVRLYTDGGDRLILSLPGDLLFQPQTAKPVTQSQQALEELATLLARLDNRLTLTGHTSSHPYEGDAYSSNWELSIVRAAAVANMLRASGYDGDLRVTGRADGQINLLASLPEAQRQTLANRVDIEILSESRSQAPIRLPAPVRGDKL